MRPREPSAPPGYALAAVLVGLTLVLLRCERLVYPGLGAVAIKSLLRSDLYQGDPAYVEALRHGYYLFAERWLGRALAGLGLAESLPAALAALQAGLWSLQICVFFRLAFLLTGGARAALAATAFFSWRARLFRIVDAPYAPDESLGRSLGLAGALPALYLYARGRRSAAWALAAASVYLHGNPGIYLVMLFGLQQGLELLRGRPWREVPWPGIAAAAALLAPIALSEAGSAGLPEPYLSSAYALLHAYSPVPRHAAADWLLLAEGAALTALAWPLFRRSNPSARLVGDFYLASLGLFLLMVFARGVAFPLGLPGSVLLVKVTSGYAYLFAAELLSLAVVCRALTAALRRGPAAALAALAVGWTLAAGADGDLLVRTAGLIVMAWLTLSPRGAPGAERPDAWGAGALAAVCVGWAFAAPRPAADKDMRRVMEWVRAETPPESFVLLPWQGARLHEFMYEAERAGFSVRSAYLRALYEHGAAALPLARRLEDLGYDPACCRDDREVDAALERAYRSLDSEGLKRLARRHGLTHAVVRDPSGLLAGAPPAFRAGPYRVHRLGGE